MRTCYRHADSDRRLAIPMTPMIDVVFLLLIFFLCTASFDPQELSLPADLVVSGGSAIDAPTEQEPELERIVLRGVADGGATRWEVNGTPCPTPAALRGLLDALAGIDPTLPVVLEPGPGVPLDDLVTAYDACRLAGFQSVRFAAAGG